MRTCTHMLDGAAGLCGKPATWHVEGSVFSPHDCCDEHKRGLEEWAKDVHRKPVITRIEDD